MRPDGEYEPIDIILQDLKAENKALRAEIQALLEQPTGFLKCWACAHSYEDMPCISRYDYDCTPVWRGLHNIGRLPKTLRGCRTLEERNELMKLLPKAKKKK